MKAVTKNYVYPAVTVTFVMFGEQVQVGAVYGITEMDNGNIYINTAEYPFHYELSDTVITVTDTGIANSVYTVEVE